MPAWGRSARHRHTEQPVPVRFAFLGAVLSALLPGLGQLYAGRRHRAVGYFAFSVLTLGVGLGAVLVGRVRILEMVVQQSWLNAAAGAITVSLLVRAVSAIDAYGCLRPLLAPPRRGAAAGLLSLASVMAVLALPHVVAARDVMAQEHLITSVFADQSETPVAAGPQPGDPGTGSATPSASTSAAAVPSPSTVAVSLPWLGRDGRFTVLLLGSDAGPSRVGARTDSMILLSIDPRTRSALMIGIPRNLDRIPFPPGPVQ